MRLVCHPHHDVPIAPTSPVGASISQGVLAKTIQASDQGVAAAVEDIRAESAGAISDLLEVIKGLHERNPAIAATPPKWQRKERRDSTALWRCADAWYEATKPFQDASIDRWQRKTLVAGGAQGFV